MNRKERRALKFGHWSENRWLHQPLCAGATRYGKPTAGVPEMFIDHEAVESWEIRWSRAPYGPATIIAAREYMEAQGYAV